MRRLLRWLRNPEVVGPPDCPILHRWTIIGGHSGRDRGPLDFKLMVHRFLPNADDRDPHDHPRGFLTFVLRGGYLDRVPCRRCRGRGGRWDDSHLGPNGWIDCRACDGEGLEDGDRMKAGTIRYRAPEYAHRTKVGPKGAWTIVVMGPLRRDWGFWRQGRWWQVDDYEGEFGFGMRCDGPPETIQKAAPVGVSTAPFVDSDPRESSADDPFGLGGCYVEVYVRRKCEGCGTWRHEGRFHFVGSIARPRRVCGECWDGLVYRKPVKT